ncbi:MAG: chromosomal replication initiator protein DnaA [Chloroflexi bacterium]|nr:chromosomal replication initiator protein DnaA [Chloroflexota bacterium]
MNDKTPATTWAAALGQLQVSVNKPNFDTWLRDTVGIRFEDDTFVVGASNDFTTEWLDVRMRKVILSALARVIGHPVAVSFEVIGADDDGTPALLTEALDATPEGGAEAGGGVPGFLRRAATPPPNLNPAFTFDTFVIGEENELAHAAAEAVVGAPGRQNPLVIFGGPGLGKTHLLNAIGHAGYAKGLTVAYATAERFGTEFGTAAQHKSFEKFRRRYRSCDILLIDDVQFLETRPGFQEEFFHTFNDLHAAGKQVVVTCDSLPSQLSGFSEALRTRLMMGLQADLRRPSFTTRLAILRAKAAHHAMRLPDAALEQIAQRCCPTVRELEGYLNRVLAHIPLVGGQATADVIERALAVFNVAPGSGRGAPGEDDAPTAPDHVITAVCRWTGTSRADLTGRSRSRDVSYARHLAMYVLRNDAKKSVAEIQRLFGNRDHSTVIGAIDRIEAELGTRDETRADLSGIREALVTASAPSPMLQTIPQLSAV